MKLEFILILFLKVFGILLNFAGLAALSNTMDTAAFGAFAAMFSAGLLVSLPAMFGMNFSLVRYTSETHTPLDYRIGLTQAALRDLVKVLMAAAAVIGVGAYGIDRLGLTPLSADDVIAITLFGVSYGFSEVLQSVARNFDGSVKAFVFREIGWRSSFFAIAIVSYLLPAPLPAAVVILCLTVSLWAILALQLFTSKIWTRVPETSAATARTDRKTIWKKAPGFMLVGSLSTSSQHLIVILASLALTLEATAHFFTSFKTMQILSLSVLAVNFVLTPRLRNLRNAENKIDTGLISTVCATAAWLNVIFCLAGIAFFALFGDFVLSFFGPEYAEDGTYLLILCVAALLNAMTGPAGFVLVMFDRQGQFNAIAAISMLSGAALCLLGGTVAGLAGFCWGYVAWIALQNISVAVYARHTLNINPTCLGVPVPSSLAR